MRERGGGEREREREERERRERGGREREERGGERERRETLIRYPLSLLERLEYDRKTFQDTDNRVQRNMQCNAP